MSQDAARRGPGYALRAALGLFTTLPARPLDTIDHGTARAAIAALPWVGLLVGIGSAGAYLIGALAGAPLLGAVLAPGVLAGASRAPHPGRARRRRFTGASTSSWTSAIAPRAGR